MTGSKAGAQKVPDEIEIPCYAIKQGNYSMNDENIVKKTTEPILNVLPLAKLETI